MQITKDPQYIGDGVYIYQDGYHLVLRADPYQIYLDPQVRHTLYEILKEEFAPEEEE